MSIFSKHLKKLKTGIPEFTYIQTLNIRKGDFKNCLEKFWHWLQSKRRFKECSWSFLAFWSTDRKNGRNPKFKRVRVLLDGLELWTRKDSWQILSLNLMHFPFAPRVLTSSAWAAAFTPRYLIDCSPYLTPKVCHTSPMLYIEI